jgi:hypothetical protein
MERSYPRLRRFTSWHYLAARRALRKEATIIAIGSVVVVRLCGCQSSQAVANLLPNLDYLAFVII